MTSYKPSVAFASVNSPGKTATVRHADEENLIPLSNANISDRQIKVCAVGEISLPPDRCRLTVRVASTKDTVEEDTDIHTNKSLRRLDSKYCMDTEIQAVFVDIHKCQTVANLLVEKLDEKVTVLPPEFYHASQTLQSLRQQASVLAIHNAKQKAQEMAKFVHQTVGRPLSIQEEESKEWSGQIEFGDDIESSKTLQQRLSQATITITSKVSVCFELKAKVKTKSLN
ncbi:hypothetical protein KUTeg_006961 [Tegillarca granosa]|uniref:Interleukin-1 receptor-associated kinase 1-binding protein 1 n=1 Tax=Tegillarca granosa TaxID=220873 RepID=A0ABQ9FBV4_TEGGR|nr:hypothetical protein KUTeg_006961 [Tegillarca granosa]